MTAEERLTEAVKALAEHFDVVQVFVQIHRDEVDATDAMTDGRGNTLARKQQIQSWLEEHCRIEPGDELTT